MQNAEGRRQKAIEGALLSAFCLLTSAFVACTPPPAPAPNPTLPPPPPEVSSIVVPIHASLGSILPLIEQQVPKGATKMDVFELDPSQRFGVKYNVQRDPIALNMQNAGLHVSAHVRYAIEGCFNARGHMFPCASCGFGEPMRDLTIELQSRFDWGSNWTLQSKTTPRPVDFGVPCRPLGLNIDWKLQSLIQDQLQDVAKSIDRNTPKLAAIRPNAQQVWSSLQTPFAIGPKTWLVIDPTDIALAPIRGSGLNVTSALILRAHTRVIVGEKPSMALKPLPPLRTVTSTDNAIRIPFDVEIPYSEVSRLLTSQFGKRTYNIEGGTLAVDTIEISAGANGRMNIAASIDYRGGHLKKYRGVVYLDGIAKFDPASSRVVIEDLEYSIDPKRRGITRALDRIAHEAVRARLRQSAKWPVTDDVASLKNEIERGVTRQLASGVNLRGHVDSLEPVSATPTKDAIVIRVVAVGRAEVEITALR